MPASAREIAQREGFEARVRNLMRDGYPASRIAKITGESYRHVSAIFKRIQAEQRQSYT